MKYVSILILSLTTIVISLKAQNMSLFLKATNSGWYPEFLNPVVDSITQNSNNIKILDVGTGPGTLPKILAMKNTDLQIVGIDIDTSMIDEARKLNYKNVSFDYEKINAPLAFSDNQFDVVTFCSILFLVDDNEKENLLNEALRVLKPNGQIIILTPSGKKSIVSAFVEVWRYKFSFNNFTFPIWKIATTHSARKWKKKNWASQYAAQQKVKYTSSLTFNENATIEIITKN